MTELETIAHAKAYIEKLAKGIDPLTGEQVSPDDIVNNPRISRCLDFVSGILGRVIENGGVERTKNVEYKRQFELSPEAAARFPFSDTPINIKEIVKRMNSLVDLNLTYQLTGQIVTDWLVGIGVLVSITGTNGRNFKRPTKKGEELGIFTETFNAYGGTYEVVLYSTNAQHYIVDNVNAAIAFKAQKVSMSGQPWTAAENARLAGMLKECMPVKKIAAILKRYAVEVRRHAQELGIPIGSPEQPDQDA